MHDKTESNTLVAILIWIEAVPLHQCLGCHRLMLPSVILCYCPKRGWKIKIKRCQPIPYFLLDNFPLPWQQEEGVYIPPNQTRPDRRKQEESRYQKWNMILTNSWRTSDGRVLPWICQQVRICARPSGSPLQVIAHLSAPLTSARTRVRTDLIFRPLRHLWKVIATSTATRRASLSGGRTVMRKSQKRIGLKNSTLKLRTLRSRRWQRKVTKGSLGVGTLNSSLLLEFI